jgi:hypothetical protein
MIRKLSHREPAFRSFPKPFGQKSERAH